MFAPAVVAGWFSALFSCTTHTRTYLTHAPTNRGSLVLGLELDSRRSKKLKALYLQSAEVHTLEHPRILAEPQKLKSSKEQKIAQTLCPWSRLMWPRHF
ncbi:hypothetical protein BDP67DRAFT_532121, partial [Colletotrichum lupini]